MNFWAIIKLIAGIIANLPFESTQDEIERVVTSAVETVQNDQDEVGINSEVSIPGDAWNELINLLVPLVQWVIRYLKK